MGGLASGLASGMESGLARVEFGSGLGPGLESRLGGPVLVGGAGWYQIRTLRVQEEQHTASTPPSRSSSLMT